MFIEAIICEKRVATWFFENEVMVGTLPSDGKLLLTEQDYKDREARWQAICERCRYDLKLKGFNPDMAQLVFSIKSRAEPSKVSSKEMNEFTNELIRRGFLPKHKDE